MRIIPGTPNGFANKTPQSHHFFKYAVSQPEVLAQSMTAYRANTPLQSFLADSGYVGVEGGKNSIFDRGKYSYKKINSREIRWPVETAKNRKGIMLKDAVCDAYPLSSGTPGKNGSEVRIYGDSDWYSPKDVIELEDNMTYLYFYSDDLPKEVEAGVFEYKSKLVTKNKNTTFIDPALLQKGSEFGVMYNMYEEMSREAYEKYSFGKMMRTFTTIMRFKWSISGTAEAMKPSHPIWLAHNNQKLWMDHADFEMMERYASYREIQSKWGKSTISESGQPQMRNERGVDIWAGDGIMYQGDGTWEVPYTKLTKEFLNSLISNIQLYRNINGHQEILFLMGRGLYNQFQDLMATIVRIDPQYIEKNNGEKGVNTTFHFYEYGGVRIYPVIDGFYDDPTRPGIQTEDGLKYSSYDGMMVSMGNRNGIMDPAVELLALDGRDFIKGTVNGMNKGGEMANSIDASHTHVISETAVAVKDPDAIIRVFKARKKKAFYI